ncbi:MAG: hypothetical protein FWC09_11830, partial [Lachnospiraceae bacterium]|nr:hypothetical protein [Lachnospiraceae bacterium]
GYEWMYGSSESKLNTEFLKDISAILRADFINYVNSLQTKHPHTSEPLTFGIDGRSGTFYNYLLEKLNEAATVSFLAEGVKNNYTWISWDGSAAHITDFNKMIAEHNKRFKGFPSFDSFKMNSMENVVFGDISDEGTHFCVYILFALNTLKDKYPDEYAKYHDAYSAILNNDDLALRVMLYNPMNFIGTEHDVDIAPYFRIRVGSKDNHTSYTVSLILALKLQETGKTNVDHAYIWGAGHGSIARADTGLIEWIDTICR